MLQFAVLTKRIKIERASEGVGEGGLGRRVTGKVLQLDIGSAVRG